MDEYFKLAMEMVKAQAQIRPMTSEEMVQEVQKVAAGLRGVSGDEPMAPAAPKTPGVTEPACDPKRAIRADCVVCVECGQKFKVMTKKHVATHGLTMDEYKAKWGFPKNTSFICHNLSNERKDKMKSMELWTRRKGKKQEGETPADPIPAESKKRKKGEAEHKPEVVLS